MIKERLNVIRELMVNEDIDVYIVPTADYHQSEYISDYFKCREYMSGFTGSAGTLVIGKDEAALYTDGRYFIQAERELKGSGIELMKMGEEGVIDLFDYVALLLKNGGKLGFDAKCIDARFGINAAERFEIKSIDLVSKLWKDRPELPSTKAFVLDEKYCGENSISKLTKIREIMKKEGARYHLLTSLCDIAWLYNIRANDVSNNPVLLAYTLIDDNEAYLFTDASRIDFSLEGVTILPYENIYEKVKNIDEAIMADVDNINYELYLLIKNLVKKHNPSETLKAIKNETEIANLYKAHIKDGVALTKFIYWLKHNTDELTEQEAINYLENLRKSQEGYIEPSFETIMAYGANAALMHYSTKGEVRIGKEGFVLVDSGGQYYEGTTDVTRTIALGALTDKMKECYTRVLKGMIALTNAHFLYGCTGRNLDILARGPLWQQGIDYKCGTGHGIGYLLNVHEGPNGFRYKKPKDEYYDCVIEEGMVSSNEPGVYFENEFGIRIENEIIAKKDIKNEYGQFMSFDTLTLAPLELEAIDYSLLSKDEILWIKKYHEMVYNKLSPFLTEDEKLWLKASPLEERFVRIKMVLGAESVDALKDKKVAIFGIGGVGGYVAEALARSGIGNFILVDNDKVSVSNINRQIIALGSTVGQYKTKLMQSRIYDINPMAKVETYEMFYLPENANEIDLSDCDYIVDCIDTITAKLDIIMRAKTMGIGIISSMGTGNKLEPTMLEVTDIYKTSVCPLAKVMRKELKKREVKKLKVVYSKEEPRKCEGERIPGSSAFVPSAAGLIIASEVVKDLL